MHRNPGREALNHFLAAALTGLAMTAISALLSVLAHQQLTTPPRTVAYAALSLLIAAAMALFGYVRSDKEQIADDLASALDQAQLGTETPATTPTAAPGVKK